MIKTIDYDIVGSYNNQRVSSIDAERSVNLFEYKDTLGKKDKSNINTSGLLNSNVAYQSPNHAFRAQFVFQDSEYDVIGTDIFKIDSNGNVTKLNSVPLNTAVGYVGVDANTFQVIFVDGENGYIYDTTTSTFAQITDESFPTNPIDVCYLDGFFVVASGGTNNFYLSSFNQGLIWGTVSGGSNTATTAASTTVTLTSGTALNYQVGTPITISSSTDANFPDGNYFIVAVLSSTTVKISATLGGMAITGAGSNGFTLTNNGQLQVGSITTHPGNIVACWTLHRRLFLFSLNYTEVWENAGIGTNLPFRRNNALLMEYGTPAIGSVSVSFDIMCFLSQTKDGLGPVMQVSGTESVPISTRALDNQLSQYAANDQISDCRSFLIKENGLIFYRMNFTAANHTFVYDVTLSSPGRDETKLWHEEEQLNGNRHIAQTHAFFNGINYVGSYNSTTRYIISSDYLTNDGEVIRRMRITRAIVPPGYQRMRIDRLQIDLLQGSISQLNPTFLPFNIDAESGLPIDTESGLDILTEQGIQLNNPQFLQVFLSISKDGGQSYGNKISAPMGNIGQRTYRTLWRKLGVIPRGQAFVAKFEFFDAVPFVILGASWAVDVLPE